SSFTRFVKGLYCVDDVNVKWSGTAEKRRHRAAQKLLDLRTSVFPVFVVPTSRLRLQDPLNRSKSRNIPLFPHVIHSFLDVFNVFRNEMRKAALRHQEILYGGAAFSGFAAIVGVDDFTLYNLEQRIQSRPDAHLTDLM